MRACAREVARSAVSKDRSKFVSLEAKKKKEKAKKAGGRKAGNTSRKEDQHNNRERQTHPLNLDMTKTTVPST